MRNAGRSHSARDAFEQVEATEGAECAEYALGEGLRTPQAAEPPMVRFFGKGGGNAASPVRIRRDEHGLRHEIGMEHRWAPFSTAAVELVRVVSVGPFPKPVAHRLFEGGVVDRRRGSGPTVQGSAGHGRRPRKVRSVQVPGDVGEAGVVELRALDGDAEAGLQPGCEVEEPGLPGPGRPTRAAGHGAPLVPPVVRCEDLDGRRFVG